MYLFVHFVCSVATAQKTYVVQTSVLFFDKRHTACNDIDVVTDGQFYKPFSDFIGISGQSADGFRLSLVIEFRH